ncbi:unnamed protein product, partial [marine sediment metagenome]
YATTLGVQFLLIEENAEEVLRLAEICKNLGLDNLQVKPYSQNPNSFNKMSIDYNKFLGLKDKLDAISTNNFKVFFRLKRIKTTMEGRDYDVCYGLPFFTVINEKGNVQPCILYYDKPEFAYGNLYEKSFPEIWEGEKRKEVLKKIRIRGCEDCRKGCRLDVINKYLHRLKNPLEHDNFI